MLAGQRLTVSVCRSARGRWQGANPNRHPLGASFRLTDNGEFSLVTAGISRLSGFEHVVQRLQARAFRGALGGRPRHRSVRSAAPQRALGEQAMSMVEERFAPKEGRGAIESDIRSWTRETAKTPDGMAQISEAVKTNSEIAAVVFHSPFQLLGFSEDTRRDLGHVDKG